MYLTHWGTVKNSGSPTIDSTSCRLDKMVSAKKIVFFLAFAVFLVSMVVARPQDGPAQEEKNGEVKPAEKEDLKTANSYGFGYGYGFGYPYGYYGLYGLGYGYPYYSYYGAYGYPFYG